MYIIGVTGKARSGKSTLSNELKQQIPNSEIIHMDKYMKQGLFDMKDEIITLYGSDIFKQNMLLSVDNFFKCFNEQLFLSQPQKAMQIWDSLIPMVNQKTGTEIKMSNKPVIIVEWVLLPKTNLFSKCDKTILVTSNFEDAHFEDRPDFAEFARKRNAVINCDFDDYEYTQVIKNNYCIESIKNIAKQIACDVSLTSIEDSNGLPISEKTER